MKLPLPPPNIITSGLLAGAVVFAGLAWSIQADAASTSREAIRVQNEEVPESDAPPPDVDEYQAILDTLDRSIAIRKRVDGLLVEVEELVGSLRRRQVEAASIAESAQQELRMIAADLYSSVTSARASSRKLNSLEGDLAVSARLAALIAEELEELDRSLGPSLGREP
ncbi:MAG: hypothetical protein ACRDLB_13920 [Actinomycetota bacterium]